MKYDGVCRYGFPKLPSPKTLLAKPVELTHPNLEEKEVKLKKAKALKLLKHAKKALEDPNFDDNMTMDEFYLNLNTNEQEYTNALRIFSAPK